MAPLGRLGCDSPPILVEYIFELFKQKTEEEPVDLIIINGDLIGHGVAIEYPIESTGKYTLLKEQHTKVQQMFSEHFPDIPVFITLGNNDAKYHY